MFDVRVRRIRTSGRRTTESDHWQARIQGKKSLGCPRTPQADEEADTRECETRPSPAGSCRSKIVKVLKQAISPSDLRNLLVHGDWWILHADGQIITVRRRDGPTHWACCEATLVQPHMLRHATGFKRTNDGHDTRSLAHYLGHRNLQSPARYIALPPDRFAKFWQD